MQGESCAGESEPGSWGLHSVPDGGWSEWHRSLLAYFILSFASRFGSYFAKCEPKNGGDEVGVGVRRSYFAKYEPTLMISFSKAGQGGLCKANPSLASPSRVHGDLIQFWTTDDRRGETSFDDAELGEGGVQDEDMQGFGLVQIELL